MDDFEGFGVVFHRQGNKKIVEENSKDSTVEWWNSQQQENIANNDTKANENSPSNNGFKVGGDQTIVVNWKKRSKLNKK